MDKTLQKDIIEWDIANWSKALQYWEKQFDLSPDPLNCLELGSNKGGLSLWLAQKGHRVICSDLNNPEPEASKIHQKYSKLNISYQSIDALEIPYENEFDIIVFKSMLGGIARDGKDENKKLVLQEIHKALKPNGKVFFAENLQATKMHQFLRKKFVKWGSSWNYLNLEEVTPLFNRFSKLEYNTVGFLGAFGPTKELRAILGNFDTFIKPILSTNSQYILIGVATK